MGHKPAQNKVGPGKPYFQNIPLGIIEWDESLNIREWHGQSTRIFGWAPHEVLDKSPFQLNLFQHKDADILIENFSKLLDRKNNEDFSVVKCFSKENKPLTVELYSSLMDRPEGKTIFSYVRDITAHKQLEDDLRSSKEDLEQFTYVVSHDLQEPLRMITGFLQVIKKKYGRDLDENGNKYIDFAVDGAERLKGLIKDLLKLSRIGRDLDFEEVDLELIANLVEDSLRVEILENDAELTIGKLPVIKADRGNMKYLFTHLISNALKFRKKDKRPEIFVSCEDKTYEWLFEVKDNGIGIMEKDFENIFVVFRRLHARSEYPGSGIGLAVCKKIIDKHGGKIWVESELGRGSAFYFSIPKK